MDEGVSKRTNAGIEEGTLPVILGMDEGVSERADAKIGEGALAIEVVGIVRRKEGEIDEDTVALKVVVLVGMDEDTRKGTDAGIEEGGLTIMEVVGIVGTMEEGIISEETDVGISVEVGAPLGNGVGTVRPLSQDKTKKKMEATSGNAIWKQLHRRIMSVATRRFQVGIEEDDDFGKEPNNESISHDPNPRHSEYYKLQLFANSISSSVAMEEWDFFVEAMALPLSVTFRISGRCNNLMQAALHNRLATQFRKLKGRVLLDHNGHVITSEVVKEIDWLPKTYQVVVDSTTLSRDKSLELLSSMLKNECLLGNVVRQELVSMIPALLLDVKASHSVIDMCAAPGSKTEQLLSLMQADADLTYSNSSSTSATTVTASGNSAFSGMVLANDIDPKRMNTLIQRFARLGSPNLIFCCGRAEDLPRNEEVFDRVLCDVPCSGDGTFRKRPYQWRLFRPRVALDLHSIQLQISASGFHLCKPGGRMVYSTCSLNPIEDEAVVAALLKLFGDAIELLDVRDPNNFNGTIPLPLLRYRPGISHWHCSPEAFTVGEKDAGEKMKSLKKLPPILPTMYPPTDELTRGELAKCMRLLPHDQDTGGFFVAVFRKKASTIPKENPVPDDNSTSTEKPPVADSATASTTTTTAKKTQTIQNIQIIKSKSAKLNTKSDSIFNPSAKSASNHALKSLGYNPKTLTESAYKAKPSDENSLTGVFGEYSFITKVRSQELWSVACENSWLKSVRVTESLEEREDPQKLSLLLFDPRSPVLSSSDEKKALAKTAQEPVKKKRKYAGIFDSKANGWKMAESEDSDSGEDEDKALTADRRNEPEAESKKVYAVSDSVRHAMSTWLRRWGGSMLIAHAGLDLGSFSTTANLRKGFQRNVFAMKCLHRLHTYMDLSRVVPLSLDDFLAIAKVGSISSEENTYYQVGCDATYSRGSGDCQLHLSSNGYNAVVRTLCQTATESNPPIGWVGVTVCPLLLREYLDAKRVSSSGSGDVDRKGPRLSKAERKKLKSEKGGGSKSAEQKVHAELPNTARANVTVEDTNGLLVMAQCRLDSYSTNSSTNSVSGGRLSISIVTTAEDCVSLAETLIYLK
eukprot:gene32948-42635_t